MLPSLTPETQDQKPEGTDASAWIEDYNLIPSIRHPLANALR